MTLHIRYLADNLVLVGWGCSAMLVPQVVDKLPGVTI